MPNQPLINALMGGQIGQQQPFGSNIFGTNNQQWGDGIDQQQPTTNPNPSPWSGTGQQSPFGNDFLQMFMQAIGQKQSPSAFFGSQPRMQPPTGMPGAWGHNTWTQGSWGQQGGQT